MFILTTTSLPGVLPTIRSRCLPIGFSPLCDQLVLELVREKGWAESGPESLVVNMAAGSPGAASAVMQSGGCWRCEKSVWDFIRAVGESDKSPGGRIKSGGTTRVQLEVRLRVLASLFGIFWYGRRPATKGINQSRSDAILSRVRPDFGAARGAVWR